MSGARACTEVLPSPLDIDALVGRGFNPLLAGIHGVSDQSVSPAVSTETCGDADGGLPDKETKIDLDAAVRAVDVALAGLDLGSKRQQAGLPPSQNDQKWGSQNAVFRGAASPQKFQGFKASPLPRRSKVPGWAEDACNREQSLQLQIQQGFQEPRFRPPQGSPPTANNRNAVRFLNPVSGVGKLAHAYTAPAFVHGSSCFGSDGDVGLGSASPLGGQSPIQGDLWGGLGSCRASPQLAYAEYLQAVLSQNKQVNPYEGKAAGVGTSPECVVGMGNLSSLPPYRADSCPELLSASPPYTLATNVERSAASFGTIGCGVMGLNHNSGVALHNLPESLDTFDNDGIWQPEPLPDVASLGNATDPKSKSEQAMLVAITGILKCAVEGYLTHKDVLSDLNFLIVTVRRHLAEYQVLSNEAAETLQVICNVLPMACNCAQFSRDVVDSLKRFMEVISTGHPLLQAQGRCLKSYYPVAVAEPRQHSEVQHLLRRIHRKLTGGTTSNGVQHVAHALYDAVGDKCSSQSTGTGVDVDSHVSSPSSLGHSLLASRSTVAGTQSPVFSDGDASSTTTGGFNEWSWM